MVRGSTQMLEVRWHKAEHFARSWFGFALEGGVPIIVLCLFSVFCTHGLCVNHCPLSDVWLLHKGWCANKFAHMGCVIQCGCTHLPNIQHASMCFQAILFIHVCVWMYISMQALIDNLLCNIMHISCIHI